MCRPRTVGVQEGKVLSERLRRAQDQNVQAEMELEALRQAKARLQQLLAQARGPLKHRQQPGRHACRA